MNLHNAKNNIKWLYAINTQDLDLDSTQSLTFCGRKFGQTPLQGSIYSTRLDAQDPFMSNSSNQPPPTPHLASYVSWWHVPSFKPGLSPSGIRAALLAFKHFAARFFFFIVI